MLKSLTYATALGSMLLAACITSTASAGQSFAIVGDAGRWNSKSKSVRDSIKRLGINQLVMPGDNIYEGSYEEHWTPWNGFSFPVVAIGNHNNGYQREIDFFKMDGEYYSRTLGGARFLVLNSDNRKNVESQKAWLEKELQKDTDAKLTFLVWHHPPYTVTSVHSWEEKYDFQVAMRSLIRRYGDKISAILVGHDHIGAFYCLDKMPMVVSGAVQDTRKPENFNYQADDKVQVAAKWVYPENTPVWSRLDLDADNERFSIKFIRASDDSVLFSSELSESPLSNICRS